MIHRNQKTCAGSGQFLTSGTTHHCMRFVVKSCLLCQWSEFLSPAAHQQLLMRLRQSDLTDSCMFLSRGKGTLGSACR